MTDGPGKLGLGLETLSRGLTAPGGQPKKLFGGFLFHFASWLTGALEVYLILYLIGRPVSLLEALIIEGLGQAIRTLAFFVPGGYGVQEGGYVLIGGLFGLSPQSGLALSLAKRAREITLGIVGLISWLRVEGKDGMPLFEGDGSGKLN